MMLCMGVAGLVQERHLARERLVHEDGERRVARGVVVEHCRAHRHRVADDHVLLRYPGAGRVRSGAPGLSQGVNNLRGPVQFRKQLGTGHDGLWLSHSTPLLPGKGKGAFLHDWGRTFRTAVPVPVG